MFSVQCNSVNLQTRGYSRCPGKRGGELGASSWRVISALT